MKSKTKYYIGNEKIAEIFRSAKLGNVTEIIILDAGEFNSAYFVAADKKEYVLKIAPQNDKNILTYEKNIMEREVAYYRLIAEKTNIKTPKIYFYDDTKKIIPSPYFIMERLRSKPMTDCRLSKSERKEASAEVGKMVAALHSIKGDAFGYPQNGVHENWYLAIKSMVNHLIEDCRKNGEKLKAGATLLNYIEKNKEILEKVAPSYTHFDIWDGNVFYQKSENGVEIALIDTERGFWGDGIGDFVSIEMLVGLKKKISVRTYNQTADQPIRFTNDELIRFNIMRAYLGLIVYSERFVRYRTSQLKYYFNAILAALLLKTAFHNLKKLQ